MASATLLLNPKPFLQLVRVLIEPNMIELTRSHPSLIYKYQRKYLAKSIRREQRIELLRFHYEFMATLVNARFYKHLVSGNFALWQSVVNSELVEILLRFPEYGREGDLSLILEKDGRPIYELSFTVVPGSIIGISAAEAMLVARIQGRKGQFDEIRRATKMCRDVSPPYLLMAAAEGVASALDIKLVAGVSASNQLSDGTSFNYGAFWETFSGEKTGTDFYVIPIPLSGTPLEQCNPGHRRRTRLKREYKVQLAEGVRATFIREYRKRWPHGTAVTNKEVMDFLGGLPLERADPLE